MRSSMKSYSSVDVAFYGGQIAGIALCFVLGFMMDIPWDSLLNLFWLAIFVHSLYRLFLGGRSESEHTDSWKQVRERSWWFNPPCIFGFSFLATMIFTVGPLVIQPALDNPNGSWLVKGLIPVAAFLAWMIGTDFYMRFISRKKRWRRMRDGGMNVCTQCGYDLRGLDAQTAQCPECGFELGKLSELGPALHKV